MSRMNLALTNKYRHKSAGCAKGKEGYVEYELAGKFRWAGTGSIC